jgi:hypothetical protein
MSARFTGLLLLVRVYFWKNRKFVMAIHPRDYRPQPSAK